MHLRAIALAALLAATAAPANSAIMQATWTSTIYHLGEEPKFGAQPDLGSPFQLRLKYDTALGNRSSIKESYEVSETIEAYLTQPLLEASVVYGDNTYTLNVDGSAWNLTQGYEPEGRAFTQTRFEGSPDIGLHVWNIDFRAFAGLGAIPDHLETPFTTSFTGDGSFRFGIYKGNDPDAVEFQFHSTSDKPGTLTVAEFEEPPTVVPEPATWALMITGLGLAGGALRRRRVIAA